MAFRIAATLFPAVILEDPDLELTSFASFSVGIPGVFYTTKAESWALNRHKIPKVMNCASWRL